MREISDYTNLLQRRLDEIDEEIKVLKNEYKELKQIIENNKFQNQPNNVYKNYIEQHHICDISKSIVYGRS
ncbi:MAG: hypothetical protein H7836_08055 [Magnetococcus sp. YQC-3]